MSQTKWLFPLLLVSAVASTAVAEPQRTLVTLENKFPRWEQLETGLIYDWAEYDNRFDSVDAWAAVPYARYGVLENLAAQIAVPFVGFDADRGGSESGLGDVEVEFQLRTYEDIFGYPYFIPHVSATIPTGDEDKGLGVDGSVVEAGISYGSRINDWIGWVLDASYRINPDVDNQFILSNSYIWEVSDVFAILTEITWEEEVEDDEDSLVMVLGGFTYNWTRDLQMGVYTGGAVTGDTDMYFRARLSYSF